MLDIELPKSLFKTKIRDLPPHLRIQIESFLAYYPKSRINTNSTVASLSKILAKQAKKEKKEQTRKNYLGESEAIIKAISAFAKENTPPKLGVFQRARQKIATSFSKFRRGPEHEIAKTESIRKKISDAIADLKIKDETREKLCSALSKQKYGVQMATQIANSVSSLFSYEGLFGERGPQDDFCSSALLVLIKREETGAKWRSFLNAAVSACESVSLDGYILHVLPWVIKNTSSEDPLTSFQHLNEQIQFEVKNSGNFRSGDFSKLTESLSPSVNDLELVGTQLAAMAQTRRMVAAQIGSSSSGEQAVNALLMLMKNKSPAQAVGLIRTGLDELNNLGNYVEKNVLDDFFCNKFLPWISKTKGEENSEPLIRDFFKINIPLTPKVQKRLVELQAHFSNPESKYEAHRKKLLEEDQYARPKEWSEIQSKFDFKTDVARALLTLCTDEKMFMDYSNLLLNGDPGEQVMRLVDFSMHGDGDRMLGSSRTPERVIKAILIHILHYDLAHRMRSFVHYGGLFEEYPKVNIMSSCMSSNENLTRIYGIFESILKEKRNESEVISRDMASAYRKMLQSHPEELNSLSTNPNPEKARKLWKIFLSKLPKPSAAKLSSIEDDRTASMCMDLLIGSPEETARFADMANQVLSSEFLAMMYLTPPLISTRTANDLELILRHGISNNWFISSKINRGISSNLIVRNKEMTVLQLAKHIEQVNAALESVNPEVNQILESNPGFMDQKNWAEWLQVLSRIADASTYLHNGFPENALQPVNQADLFSTFLQRYGYDSALMESVLTKVGKAAAEFRSIRSNISEDMRAYYFMDHNGAAKLVVQEFSNRPNFEELLNLTVNAYRISRGMDFQMNGYFLGNGFILLSEKPAEFSRRISFIDRHLVQNQEISREALPMVFQTIVTYDLFQERAAPRRIKAILGALEALGKSPEAFFNAYSDLLVNNIDEFNRRARLVSRIVKNPKITGNLRPLVISTFIENDLFDERKMNSQISLLTKSIFTRKAPESAKSMTMKFIYEKAPVWGFEESVKAAALTLSPRSIEREITAIPDEKKPDLRNLFNSMYGANQFFSELGVSSEQEAITE
ncbi:hypothetical protein KJ780_04355, partial [Candidatus Micrarchaeota archaeon]|nr:hypothetical protein [Candidatus Micrarchaeota archaeon]